MFKKAVLFLSVIFSALYTYAQTPQHRITLNPSYRPFYHGVESGDPTEDRMIIWTRVTPDTGATGDIEVFWQMATDTGFTNVVNYGKAVATEANHYCVKVDVCGLQPARFYYYMFNAQGRNSIVGRTKTAPSSTTDNDSVKFAIVSCASWEHGFFNVYQSISNRNDVDAVLHLGDYVYEYESGGFTGNVAGRTYDPPTEAITEVGYELRYSQYKLDDQLRRIHQLFPFITVWDDHETCNDAWREGGQNHTPGTEGNYLDRKRNSTSTYFKWMPIRKPDPLDSIRIFRKLRYGKLLDLVMLDTRLYDRDEQDLGGRDDSTRHMMGPVERAWFLAQLSDTTTRWKIIGNQVMFAPLQVFGTPVNADQWDGYNYERTLIQNHITNTPVKNVVVLTGDIHTSWCNDVPGPNYDANTGAGSVCVEFVGTSVTSLNSPLPVGANIIKSLNPHMKYINLDDHGYYELDVKKNKTQADYTYISTVEQLGANDVNGVHYYVNNNERHLRQSNSADPAPQIAAPKPALLPNQNIPFNKITDHTVSIPENTQVTVNVIPSLQICPLVNLNIVSAQHGGALSLNGQDVTYVPSTDYSGNDTVMLTVCTNEVTPVCDTVFIFVTINSVQDIDTITVDLNRDSTYTGCVHFNDISFYTGSINYSQPLNGTITLTDSCFTYNPDSAFGGFETITFIACNNNGCDTVVYIFKVDHPITASVIDLQLNKNTNITECLVFDDLVGEPVSINVILAPQHGTYQWVGGDSCVKYFPYFNYVGNDTMRFVACDNSGLNHCDTITIIYHVTEPTAVEETNNLVVFGMYPNPVNDKLIVQYYLYDAEEVTMNVYDINGRLISQGNLSSTTTGLHHAQLNTGELAAGNYVVELKTSKLAYRKKIVKE
jgi:alkaline phosphatase D